MIGWPGPFNVAWKVGSLILMKSIFPGLKWLVFYFGERFNFLDSPRYIHWHWGKWEHLKVEGRHHFKGEKDASQRKRKSLYSPYGVFSMFFSPCHKIPQQMWWSMAVDATATIGKIFPYLNLEVYRTCHLDSFDIYTVRGASPWLL